MASAGSMIRTMITLIAPPCMAASIPAKSCPVTAFARVKSASSFSSLAFTPSVPLRNQARRFVTSGNYPRALPPTGPVFRSRTPELLSGSLRASSSVPDTTEKGEKASKLRNSDPAAVCVVIGGGRGIGLAMVEDMLARFQGRIFATARDPSKSEALLRLQQEHPDRITTLPMDVTDEDSVQAAAAMISTETAGRIDVLLNTAGILHDQNEPTSEGRMPERQLSQLTQEWFLHNMQVNCMGPMLLLKHMQPMLIATPSSGRPFSVFASLSARVGSIEDNRLGGWYSYRVSKAAHNQLIRTAAVELNRRGCVIVALHPGTVNTGLSEPFQARVKPEKLFAVDKSAGMLLDVVDSLDQPDTGSFFAYDGSRIPW